MIEAPIEAAVGNGIAAFILWAVVALLGWAVYMAVGKQGSGR